MAVVKQYRCDLCGELATKSEIRRIGVRRDEDRTDGATWVDVGPCCHMKPISEFLVKAVELSGEEQ